MSKGERRDVLYWRKSFLARGERCAGRDHVIHKNDLVKRLCFTRAFKRAADIFLPLGF